MFSRVLIQCGVCVVQGGRVLEAHLQHDLDPGEEEDQAGPARFHQLRRLPPDN